MKAVIVGGGIGGLTVAGFLHRAGMEVRLLERSRGPVPSPYGVGLWSPAVEVLGRLGLREALTEAGQPLFAWDIRNAEGELLDRIDLDWEGSLPFTLVHSARLKELLGEVLPPNAIVRGANVADVDDGEDGGVARVVLADGSVIEGDVIIGADGARSVVREKLFDAELEDTGTVTWAFWVPDGIDMPDVGTEMWCEGGRLFVTAPLAERTMAALSAPCTDAVDDVRAALRSEGSRLGWVVPRIVEALPSGAPIHFTRNLRVRVSPWHTRRVALLGDAAHAIHPLVGLGASLAMEDAWVLAGALERGGPERVPEALAQYYRRRRGRVRKLRRHAAMSFRLAFTRSPTVRRTRDFLAEHTALLERLFREETRLPRGNLGLAL